MLICVIGLFVGSMQVREVKAQSPVTITRAFKSLASDGCIGTDDMPTYEDARNSTSGTVSNVATSSYLGQANYGTFYVYRMFPIFDTTPIPDGAVLDSSILSISVSTYYLQTNFNVTIQSGQPAHPNIPLESSDFYYGYYIGDGGSRNTNTIIGSGYWNITLNSIGLSWINLQGTTKLCLRNLNDINGIAPGSSSEMLIVMLREKGEAYAPTLYVTYTTEGYTYIVNGPYFESGSVANALVTLTLQIQNMPSQSYVLNGTDGIADNLNIQVEQRGIVFTWNFTVYTNYTRVYALTSSTFEEIWIFIPNVETDSVYLYTFEVNNFAGLTNTYLESVINVGGYNRIVERQSCNVINLIPFYMIFSHHYTLRLISDQGSYTWGDFIALSDTAISLTVRGVDFPKETLYKFKYVRVYGLRIFANPYGNISIIYEDLLTMTNSVTIYINYLNGTNAYNATEYSNAFVHEWLSAKNNTDYCARIVIDHSRYGVYEWKQLFTRTNTVNPWDLGWLGKTQFDSSTLIAVLIVIFSGGCFSMVNPEIGAFAACATATILRFMGWLPVPIELLIGAWAFTIIFAVVMARVRVRT